MIKKTTIDAVHDIPVIQVLEKYLPELKKKGANYMCKSPFKDEKTASFSVSPAKNCWKCFATGNGGSSAISFLMQKESMSYPDAIREIATNFSIDIEYDNTEDGKKFQAKREEEQSLSDVNRMAMEYFNEKLLEALANKKLTLKEVRASKEEIEDWTLGYAPDDWQELFNRLISKGVSEKLILKSGLAKVGKKGPFNFFRKRIMFPIFNKRNQISGFSGRYLGDFKKDEQAKYLNTGENEIFNKSEAFLGLEMAKEEMIRTRSATIVEGNYDVISSHRFGYQNSVANCGTAFTLQHVKVLKSFKVNLALIIFDGDEAGLTAAKKATRILMSEGITPQVAILPDGQDPDDHFKKADPKEFEELITDGVEWYASILFKDTKTVADNTNAQKELEEFLSLIQDSKLRKNYTSKFAKDYKLSKTDLDKSINTRIKELAGEDEDDLYKFPRKLTIDEKKEYEQQVKKYSFYEDESKFKKGYWFLTQYKTFEMASNFIVNPLFHIFSHSNNRRLVQIENKDQKAIIEVPSKGFINVNGFLEECINHMSIQWVGTPKQFKYAALKFMDQMPIALEVITLGWQDEGFFAFADGAIIDGRFKAVDDYGMITMGEEVEHYFLPAFSSIYKRYTGQDDPYESDRALKYRASNISFAEWSAQYYKVHQDNAMFSLAHFGASLFRDIIQKKLGYFPILFNFGDVQTGKSKAAKGIFSVCLGNQAPLNLHTGTLAALNRKLAQFRNVPIWFEEYNNEIDDKMFQTLKMVWDGVGREKGRATMNNKTTSDKVESPVIISGQFIPNRDSNSLNTRCMLITYDIKKEDRTSQDLRELDKLEEMEEKGLSQIVGEIIKYRDLIKKDFADVFLSLVSEFKIYLNEQGINYNGRVLDNYMVVMAVYQILLEKIDWPFDYDEFKKAALKALIKQSETISDTNVLQSYWKMVEFLFIQGQISYGHDFDIQIDQNNCRLYTTGKNSEMMDFKQPKRLLFIQFSKIHPLYMEAHRKQAGVNGTNESSIKSYMKSSKAFIGVTPNHEFETKRTSAFVFDYDQLDITLQHRAKSPAEK